jgi:hypothetical protein
MPPTDGVDRWHFPQGDVVLHANGHQQLIEAIFEYRLRNHIEIGDIERDVDDYYCGRWPDFCHSEPSDRDPSIPRVSGETMLNRVSRWASGLARTMPRGGWPLQVVGEAERRAGICAACPQNAGWRGGCLGCSASTLQLLQQIKGMRKTKQDGNLIGCLVAGWENSTAVWLGQECLTVTENQRRAMPDACWRKALP